MADIVLELNRAQAAFERPALGLLNQKNASLVVAIFRVTFSRELTQVVATTFHSHVRGLLEILGTRGYEDLPDAAQPRQLCREWVRRKWLILDSREDGEEFYALTSHAQDAMDFVQNLGSERALLSESRIRTILDVARQSAMDANPDREERLQRLNRQIIELRAERDRLAKGGVIEIASDDRMLETFLNLADLLNDLPSDFKRVEELVTKMHREIISDFRTDERPKGEVVGDYMARSRDALNNSVEGRAYQGALNLLAREAMLASLRSDIETILSHPFAQSLSRTDRERVTALAGLLMRGVETIQEQQRHLTATLRTNLVQREALRSQELDSVLNDLKHQLAERIGRSGVRTRTALPLTPAKLEVATLRERFYDPADHAPPPPLEDAIDDTGGISAEDIRQQGGPSFARLRSALLEGLAGDHTVSAADIFNRLPAADRRPVEVLGVLYVAGEALTRSDGEDVFEAVRSDGTRVAYRAPHLTFTDEDRDALTEAEDTQ
ncbi:DUF3375 family protein [Arthrobacter sp. NamB2]|uniref:DUF3375 family protein n=1 Tax=Arthrobacter sp. NamB2 TaxID=2576035 RepID=UPI00167632C2|nr:DUF3375 family protein [Arthrobacter sp. NamB2]